ncbi:transcription factor with AP2 domain(s), putative [Plasmodium vinckei]|uniref:Transcription factor with AP2 domain(S), putative n=1 Tax=Plasmodium vinckei TaxID=5860 RepID=A0A6V7SSK3_PLAVN|nr:transcription factor with AP2 domain(s), putative [Plasmodium vinckei]
MNEGEINDKPLEEGNLCLFAENTSNISKLRSKNLNSIKDDLKKGEKHKDKKYNGHSKKNAQENSFDMICPNSNQGESKYGQYNLLPYFEKEKYNYSNVAISPHQYSKDHYKCNSLNYKDNKTIMGTEENKKLNNIRKKKLLKKQKCIIKLYNRETKTGGMMGCKNAQNDDISRNFEEEKNEVKCRETNSNDNKNRSNIDVVENLPNYNDFSCFPQNEIHKHNINGTNEDKINTVLTKASNNIKKIEKNAKIVTEKERSEKFRKKEDYGGIRNNNMINIEKGIEKMRTNFSDDITTNIGDKKNDRNKYIPNVNKKVSCLENIIVNENNEKWDVEGILYNNISQKLEHNNDDIVCGIDKSHINNLNMPKVILPIKSQENKKEANNICERASKIYKDRHDVCLNSKPNCKINLIKILEKKTYKDRTIANPIDKVNSSNGKNVIHIKYKNTPISKCCNKINKLNHENNENGKKHNNILKTDMSISRLKVGNSTTVSLNEDKGKVNENPKRIIMRCNIMKKNSKGDESSIYITTDNREKKIIDQSFVEVYTTNANKCDENMKEAENGDAINSEDNNIREEHELKKKKTYCLNKSPTTVICEKINDHANGKENSTYVNNAIFGIEYENESKGDKRKVSYKNSLDILLKNEKENNLGDEDKADFRSKDPFINDLKSEEASCPSKCVSTDDVNSVLLNYGKKSINNYESLNNYNDNYNNNYKKKKKRTGIPLNERKYYRVLAKQMIKIQGLTFDHNQIRWIAYWKNENNKQIQKHFPVCKYGFYKARQLALEFRNSKINEKGGNGKCEKNKIVNKSETIYAKMNKKELSKKGSEKIESILNNGKNVTVSRLSYHSKSGSSMHGNAKSKSKISGNKESATFDKGNNATNVCNINSEKIIPSKEKESGFNFRENESMWVNDASNFLRNNEHLNAMFTNNGKTNDINNYDLNLSKRLNSEMNTKLYDNNGLIGNASSFHKQKQFSNCVPISSDINNSGNFLCQSKNENIRDDEVNMQRNSMSNERIYPNDVPNNCTNGYCENNNGNLGHNYKNCNANVNICMNIFENTYYNKLNNPTFSCDQNKTSLWAYPQNDFGYANHFNKFEGSNSIGNIGMNGIYTENRQNEDKKFTEWNSQPQYLVCNNKERNDYYYENDSCGNFSEKVFMHANIGTEKEGGNYTSEGERLDWKSHYNFNNVNNIIKNDNDLDEVSVERENEEYNNDTKGMHNANLANNEINILSNRNCVYQYRNSNNYFYDVNNNLGILSNGDVINREKYEYNNEFGNTSSMKKNIILHKDVENGVVLNKKIEIVGDNNAIRKNRKADSKSILNLLHDNRNNNFYYNKSMLNPHLNNRSESNEQDFTTKFGDNNNYFENVSNIVNAKKKHILKNHRINKISNSEKILEKEKNKVGCNNSSTAGTQNITLGRSRKKKKKGEDNIGVEKETNKNDFNITEKINNLLEGNINNKNPEKEAILDGMILKNKNKLKSSIEKTNTIHEFYKNGERKEDGEIIGVKGKEKKQKAKNRKKENTEKMIISADENLPNHSTSMIQLIDVNNRCVNKNYSDNGCLNFFKKGMDNLNYQTRIGEMNGTSYIENKISNSIIDGKKSDKKYRYSKNEIKNRSNELYIDENNIKYVYNDDIAGEPKIGDGVDESYIIRKSEENNFAIEIDNMCYSGINANKKRKKKKKKGNESNEVKNNGYIGKVSDSSCKNCIENVREDELDKLEICSYKLKDDNKKNTKEDNNINYFHKIMKIPKMKGVHFDIRQKRWCAYGYKKKECFSVYRYGFLAARELAVRSRLNVQKRRNNLRLKKKNKNDISVSKRKSISLGNVPSKKKRKKECGDISNGGIDNTNINGNILLKDDGRVSENNNAMYELPNLNKNNELIRNTYCASDSHPYNIQNNNLISQNDYYKGLGTDIYGGNTCNNYQAGHISISSYPKNDMLGDRSFKDVTSDTNDMGNAYLLCGYNNNVVIDNNKQNYNRLNIAPYLVGIKMAYDGKIMENQNSLANEYNLSSIGMGTQINNRTELNKIHSENDFGNYNMNSINIKQDTDTNNYINSYTNNEMHLMDGDRNNNYIFMKNIEKNFHINSYENEYPYFNHTNLNIPNEEILSKCFITPNIRAPLTDKYINRGERVEKYFYKKINPCEMENNEQTYYHDTFNNVDAIKKLSRTGNYANKFFETILSNVGNNNTVIMSENTFRNDVINRISSDKNIDNLNNFYLENAMKEKNLNVEKENAMFLNWNCNTYSKYDEGMWNNGIENGDHMSRNKIEYSNNYNTYNGNISMPFLECYNNNFNDIECAKSYNIVGKEYFNNGEYSMDSKSEITNINYCIENKNLNMPKIHLLQNQYERTGFNKNVQINENPKEDENNQFTINETNIDQNYLNSNKINKKDNNNNYYLFPDCNIYNGASIECQNTGLSNDMLAINQTDISEFVEHPNTQNGRNFYQNNVNNIGNISNIYCTGTNSRRNFCEQNKNGISAEMVQMNSPFLQTNYGETEEKLIHFSDNSNANTPKINNEKLSYSIYDNQINKYFINDIEANNNNSEYKQANIYPDIWRNSFDLHYSDKKNIPIKISFLSPNTSQVDKIITIDENLENFNNGQNLLFNPKNNTSKYCIGNINDEKETKNFRISPNKYNDINSSQNNNICMSRNDIYTDYHNSNNFNEENTNLMIENEDIRNNGSKMNEFTNIFSRENKKIYHDQNKIDDLWWENNNERVFTDPTIYPNNSIPYTCEANNSSNSYANNISDKHKFLFNYNNYEDISLKKNELNIGTEFSRSISANEVEINMQAYEESKSEKKRNMCHYINNDMEYISQGNGLINEKEVSPDQTFMTMCNLSKRLQNDKHEKGNSKLNKYNGNKNSNKDDETNQGINGDLVGDLNNLSNVKINNDLNPRCNPYIFFNNQTSRNYNDNNNFYNEQNCVMKSKNENKERYGMEGYKGVFNSVEGNFVDVEKMPKRGKEFNRNENMLKRSIDTVSDENAHFNIGGGRNFIQSNVVNRFVNNSIKSQNMNPLVENLRNIKNINKRNEICMGLERDLNCYTIKRNNTESNSGDTVNINDKRINDEEEMRIDVADNYNILDDDIEKGRKNKKIIKPINDFTYTDNNILKNIKFSEQTNSITNGETFIDNNKYISKIFEKEKHNKKIFHHEKKYKWMANDRDISICFEKGNNNNDNGINSIGSSIHRVNKKGTILKNVHITNKFNNKFMKKCLQIDISFDKNLKKKYTQNEKLINNYHISIFKNISINKLLSFRWNIKRKDTLMESYCEYICLTLHDINMNRSNDASKTIYFKKVIYKFLIIDLFKNLNPIDFSNNGNTVENNGRVGKHVLFENLLREKKIQKHINILKKVEKYHIDIINNMYDLKSIQLYIDIFVTCLLKNIPSSKLSYDEHNMLMRSLLLFYFDSNK